MVFWTFAMLGQVCPKLVPPRGQSEIWVVFPVVSKSLEYCFGSDPHMWACGIHFSSLPLYVISPMLSRAKGRPFPGPPAEN